MTIDRDPLRATATTEPPYPSTRELLDRSQELLRRSRDLRQRSDHLISGHAIDPGQHPCAVPARA